MMSEDATTRPNIETVLERINSLGERMDKRFEVVETTLEQMGTPLLSLETQTPVRDFDLVAFSISFETDFLNMARMLRLARVPVWAKDRTHHDPLVVMGGAASFLNPEPIAEFTDVVAVGEGEILVPKLVDLLFENAEEGGTKEDLLLKLARVG